jgi:hypothetical protein
MYLAKPTGHRQVDLMIAAPRCHGHRTNGDPCPLTPGQAEAPRSRGNGPGEGDFCIEVGNAAPYCGQNRSGSAIVNPPSDVLAVAPPVGHKDPVHRGRWTIGPSSEAEMMPKWMS